jgi:hypothetical protein
MRRSKTYFILVAALTLLTISTPVFGQTGSLRIDPPLPTMTGSPADFDIWAQSGTANDPHIFLVITEACFDGLSEDVTVSGGGDSVTVLETDWVGPLTTNGDKYPPGASEGAGYTVASLQDHLGTDGPIYYAFKSILGGATLTSTKVPITVTLASLDPEMLVYVLGKSPGQGEYDMSIPPTIPGFVVPEIPMGTIMGLASMIVALAIFAKRQPIVLPR